MKGITALVSGLWVTVLVLAGCSDAAPSAIGTPIPLVTPAGSSAESPPVTPVVLEGFPMPVTDGNRLFYYHEGDLTCWTIDRTDQMRLQVYRTDDRGKQWNSVPLPLREDWEGLVPPDPIRASFHPKGSSWILLQSNPNRDVIVRKSLYRSNPSGTEWLWAADLTEQIGGGVLDMSIQSDGTGFIVSSPPQADGVPLYRTEDMGVSWKPLNLPVRKGSRFEKSYLPVMDSDGRGTVRTEYVMEGKPITEYFETTDHGASWHRFDTASILDLQGDPEALKAIKRFLDAWQRHDSKALATMWEGGEPITSYDWMWESGREVVFYGVHPSSVSPDSSRVVVGAKYYEITGDDSVQNSVMAIGVRKQADSGGWKVYFLD